jgi:surface antigen
MLTPRRLPLALVAATATVVAGYSLSPLTTTSAAPAPSLRFSAAAAVSTDLEPAPLHAPVARPVAKTVTVAKAAPRPAAKTVVVTRKAPATQRVHKTTTAPAQKMAPASASGATSEEHAKLPVKPAPKPAPKPAASASYPWASSNGQGVDTWGFTQRQCVSYAAWRLNQAGHTIDNNAGWGDASHWDSTARARGWSVSSAAHVGDVAQWNAYERSDYFDPGASRASGTFEAGEWGHVGYVTKVYSDGSVQVAQYNALGDINYSSMHMRAPRYLHV